MESDSVGRFLSGLLNISSILLINLLSTDSTAQEPVYPLPRSFPERSQTYYLPTKGNHAITCFHFDKKGFLWLGTYTGLYRFDGTEFRNFGFRQTDNTGFDGQMISSICEDYWGNMWISTSGALNFLEISTGLYKKYYPDSENPMSVNNRIRNMILSSDSILYLVTNGDFYSFNIGAPGFKRYTIENASRPLGDVPYSRGQGQIIEDSEKNIWFTSRNGLYCLDHSKDSLVLFQNHPQDPSSLSSNYVTCIIEDTRKRIWVSTKEKGLNLVEDPVRGVFSRINLNEYASWSAEFDSLNVLLPDQDGSIWIFGGSVFGKYMPDKGQFRGFIITSGNKFNFRSELKITKALQVGKDEIIFHSEPGRLFRYNLAEKMAELYIVPGYANYNIFHGKDGSVWISGPVDNFWQLVNRLPKFQTKTVLNSGGLDMTRQNNIAEDRAGNLWLALSSGILIINKTDVLSPEFKARKFYFPDGDSISGTVKADSEGNIWLKPLNGPVIRIDGRDRNNIKKFYAPGNVKLHVHSFEEDTTHAMWFTDQHFFYNIRRESGRIERIGYLDGLFNLDSSRYIFDFIIDKNNVLWLARFDNGISSYNLTDKTYKHYSVSKESNLRSGDICLRVKEDRKGNIWLLFANTGLFILKRGDEIIEQVNPSGIIPHGIFFLDFIIDRDDNPRVITNKGMLQYDQMTGNARLVSFSFATDNCFSYQLGTGEIVVLNNRNLIVFPERSSINEIVPEVFLTSLKVNENEYGSLFPDSSEIRSLKSIRLRSNQNNLKIEFSALSFLEAENNSYRYFMKGIDRDTILTSSIRRFTEYKKMKPGTYTFWYNGSNNDGIWYPGGKILKIRISPPWYRSAVAFVAYISFIITIAFFLIRWRVSNLKMENKYLEEVVRLRTAELEDKNRHIEELDTMKTKFFTEISHEIRTPLSLITGPVEALISENESIDNERRLKWMQIIRNNSQKLMRLVNQLMDISRLDAGKMKLTLSEDDLMKFLRIQGNEFLSMGESRRIEFSMEIPEEPYFTKFDHDKVEKVTINLLANAFRFTPSGGKIKFRAEIADPVVAGSEATLLLEVSDTGIGIGKDDIKRIFDRFYRVEGNREEDGAGTGIGLSIVKEFITLMQGSIEVESHPGLGSTFRISVPLGYAHLRIGEYTIIATEQYNESSSEGTQELIHQNMTETVSVDGNPKILVVEDNDDLRLFIRENLETQYFVLEAVNGNEGMKTALTVVPDLIITDIIMPDINGINLCGYLKEDERTSHIPVIILTAKTAVEEKIAGFESGADEYLYKPFDINELKARIDNLLKQRERLRLRFGALTGYEHKEIHGSSLDEKFMNRVAKTIDEHLSEFDFDVGVLQEKMGMSRVHLYRKIHALTGMAPSLLIRNFRMKRAAHLIVRKSLNLSQIALSVGISNPAHFSKCFKEYYGVSPKNFNGNDHISSNGIKAG